MVGELCKYRKLARIVFIIATHRSGESEPPILDIAGGFYSVWRLMGHDLCSHI